MNLIELMIAITIGLILLAGMVQVFLSGKSSYSLQERVGDMQENGRFAQFFLQQSLRMAGFPKIKSKIGICAFATTLEPADITKCGRPMTGFEVCDGCGAGGSDQVSVRYVASGNKAGDGIFDCAGTRVPIEGTVRETFFVERGADNISRLMCRGWPLNEAGIPMAPQTQPLVDGIESMQILYGVDTDPAPPGEESPPGVGFADTYVTADEVVGLFPSLPVAERYTAWENVVSVRVAVLASTIAPLPGDDGLDVQGAAQTYTVLDATNVAVTDQNGNPTPAVRAGVFTTTIEIRNRSSAQ